MSRRSGTDEARIAFLKERAAELEAVVRAYEELARAEGRKLVCRACAGVGSTDGVLCEGCRGTGRVGP